MAEQIYRKTFQNENYSDEDIARTMTLELANNFFIKHDSVDIINVIERWDENKKCFHLIVYYKDYV